MKISNKVFDDQTMTVLHYFLSNKRITSLDFPIAQGKEAMVFRATTPTGYAAVKIFKYETASFRKRMQYVQGDPRFKVPKGLRSAVRTWARKEFANLSLCIRHGVRSPRPIAFKENVVIMEWLGVGGIPSASLKDVWMDDPQRMLNELLEDVKKMREAGLVHADLSEYNIVVHENHPYLLDVGQSVLLSHEGSEGFFLKDVRNILKFFKRRGVKMTEEDALNFVRGA